MDIDIKHHSRPGNPGLYTRYDLRRSRSHSRDRMVWISGGIGGNTGVPCLYSGKVLIRILRARRVRRRFYGLSKL